MAICQTVSLPEKSGQWLLNELTKDELKAKGNLNQLKAKLNLQLDELNQKLNKLLNLYLDTNISQEDYLQKKNELISQRKTIEEQLLNLSEFQNDNIQKAKDFVRLTIQAGKISKQYLKIAENEDHQENRIEPKELANPCLETVATNPIVTELADFLKSGIEPILKRQKSLSHQAKTLAALMPPRQVAIWSRLRDSDSGSRSYHERALPTELRRLEY